jgi:hypothetical protein
MLASSPGSMALALTKRRRASLWQAKAARWLGVTRVTMRQKLVQYGLLPGSPGQLEGR